jgi:hypothetical protein
VEDDRPHPGHLRDLAGGLDDPLEHRPVEGVVLLRAVQGDEGDVVRDLDGDALAHD